MSPTRTRPPGSGSGSAPGPGSASDDTRALFERARRRGSWLRWRWVVVAVLVLALAAGGTWLVAFSSVLAADEVEVEGTSVLGDAEVLAAARVPLGTPLARIDLDAIELRVEAMAAVSEARVTRAWPHAVRIDVDERTAIAVVARGDSYRGLDAEGIAFRDYETPPEDLPLVELGEDTDGEAVREAARVVGAMPERTARRVASIQVATVDEITLSLRDGGTVVWGSAEDSSEKADVLDALLALDLEVEEYDVSVPARPTTR